MLDDIIEGLALDSGDFEFNLSFALSNTTIIPTVKLIEFNAETQAFVYSLQKLSIERHSETSITAQGTVVFKNGDLVMIDSGELLNSETRLYGVDGPLMILIPEEDSIAPRALDMYRHFAAKFHQELKAKKKVLEGIIEIMEEDFDAADSLEERTTIQATITASTKMLEETRTRLHADQATLEGAFHG